VDEIVRRHREHAIADQASPASALDDDRMRVLMALERRVSAGRNLEVAQLTTERGIVEQDLARDIPKRRAAFLFVREHVDILPAHLAGSATVGR